VYRYIRENPTIVNIYEWMCVNGEATGRYIFYGISSSAASKHQPAFAHFRAASWPKIVAEFNKYYINNISLLFRISGLPAGQKLWQNIINVTCKTPAHLCAFQGCQRQEIRAKFYEYYGNVLVIFRTNHLQSKH
jgi:hypothetical protein